MTISSPLTTQLPQVSGRGRGRTLLHRLRLAALSKAAGHAYALKMDAKPNVVVCYFGEGAASEVTGYAFILASIGVGRETSTRD